MGVRANPPPCHSFSSSSPWSPLPAVRLTIRSLSTDLERKMLTLIKMCEQPSATLAWKSQSQAMEEPRSINQTGWADSQDGSLWENMVPFWTADNAQHITPDPMSNPVIYYLKWVVSETVGGFNAGLMNDDYTDGIICPYEIPDQWQYEYDRQWFVDPTLRFVCTKFRDAEEA